MCKCDSFNWFSIPRLFVQFIFDLSHRFTLLLSQGLARHVLLLHPEAQLQLHCAHPQGAASTAPRFDPVRRGRGNSITPSLRQALQLWLLHAIAQLKCPVHGSDREAPASHWWVLPRLIVQEQFKTRKDNCYKRLLWTRKYTYPERSNVNLHLNRPAAHLLHVFLFPAAVSGPSEWPQFIWFFHLFADPV